LVIITIIIVVGFVRGFRLFYFVVTVIQRRVGIKLRSRAYCST